MQAVGSFGTFFGVWSFLHMIEPSFGQDMLNDEERLQSVVTQGTAMGIIK